jgi:hypothetical protein
VPWYISSSVGSSNYGDNENYEVIFCPFIFSYEVIILEGTYVIGEGKMWSVYPDIELCL